MDAKLKADWVKALLGKLPGKKYQQGKQALKAEGKFCCLGVLADIQGAKWVNGEPLIVGGVRDEQQGCMLLRPKFAGGLRRSAQKHLAQMNDQGADFKKIADHIERRIR